jgi:hypothetical protein
VPPRCSPTAQSERECRATRLGGVTLAQIGQIGQVDQIEQIGQIGNPTALVEVGTMICFRQIIESLINEVAVIGVRSSFDRCDT